MNPKEPNDDYRDFLSSTDSAHHTESGRVKPDLSKITRDLVPSPWHLGVWYLGVSVIGYLASLLICAQHSIGFFGFAHDVAKAIHHLPDPWCPMICGALFTGIPFLLSAAFLSRFQHRYLILKMWWFFAAVPIVGSMLMIILPQSLQHQKMAQHLDHLVTRPQALSETAWMTVWALSAILFPYLLELFVWRFVAPKRSALGTLTTETKV